MPRVVHFEIHSENPERAVAFYTEVLGWSSQRWGTQEYWLMTTGADSERGINGAVLRRRGPGPQEMQAVNAFVCTVEVPVLDDYLQRVLRAGGTQALAKMAIPGVGWLAYCKDPDGNIFGLMQTDPAAK